jgi:hypothetical protein
VEAQYVYRAAGLILISEGLAKTVERQGRKGRNQASENKNLRHKQVGKRSCYQTLPLLPAGDMPLYEARCRLTLPGPEGVYPGSYRLAVGGQWVLMVAWCQYCSEESYDGPVSLFESSYGRNAGPVG